MARPLVPFPALPAKKWVKENKRPKASPISKTINSQAGSVLISVQATQDAVISDIPGMEHLFSEDEGFAVKDQTRPGQYGLMMAKDHPLPWQAQRCRYRHEAGCDHCGYSPQRWFGTEPATGFPRRSPSCRSSTAAVSTMLVTDGPRICRIDYLRPLLLH